MTSLQNQRNGFNFNQSNINKRRASKLENIQQNLEVEDFILSTSHKKINDAGGNMKEIRENIQNFIKRNSIQIMNRNMGFTNKNITRKKNLSISENILMDDLTKTSFLDSKSESTEDNKQVVSFKSSRNYEINNEEKFKNVLTTQENNQLIAKKNSDQEFRLRKIKKVYDSISDNEIEALKSNQMIFINPNSRFKKRWDYFVCSMMIFSCFYVPYHAFCFYKNDSFFIEILLEMIFIADFFTHFFLQIENENEILIANYKKIALNYLSDGFFLDLICSFPFKILAYYFGNGRTDVSLLFSSHSIYSWLSHFRVFKLNDYPFFGNLEIVQNSKINSLLHLSILFIIFMHISSCFWLYLAKSSSNAVNWIFQYNFQNSLLFEQYIASFYFNLVTVYTIGYGDILSTNLNERTFNLFLLICGVGIYAFGVTNISTIFRENEKREVEYENKCRIFEEISKDYQIPLSLKSKVEFQILLDYNNNYSDRFTFLSSLSPLVKRQLTIKMYEKLINEIHFLKNQSSDFVIFILPFLQNHVINKNEILYEVGDSVVEMYIITEGSFSITLGREFEDLEIATLHKFHHFGELLLYSEEISPYDLKSKSRVTKVLILKKEDFNVVKSHYNSIIIEILKDSLKTMEKIEKRRIQFLKLMNQYNSVSNVKLVIQKINMQLMEKGFEEYYYNDKDFEDLNDLIVENEFQSLQDNNATDRSHKISFKTEFLQKIDKRNNQNQMLPNEMNIMKNMVPLELNIHEISARNKEEEKSLLQIRSIVHSPSKINNSPVKQQNFLHSYFTRSESPVKNQIRNSRIPTLIEDFKIMISQETEQDIDTHSVNQKKKEKTNYERFFSPQIKGKSTFVPKIMNSSMNEKKGKLTKSRSSKSLISQIESLDLKNKKSIMNYLKKAIIKTDLNLKIQQGPNIEIFQLKNNIEMNSKKYIENYIIKEISFSCNGKPRKSKKRGSFKKNEQNLTNNYNIFQGDMYVKLDPQINLQRNNFFSKIHRESKKFDFPIFKERNENMTVEDLNSKLESLIQFLQRSYFHSKK